MNNGIHIIDLWRLTLSFLPVIVVLIILFKWSLHALTGLYALGRMLAQLILIGYFLSFLFETAHFQVITGILIIMLSISSWIALRTIEGNRLVLYGYAFLSIFTGGGLTLILITQGVLDLSPWYFPRYMIPLAGMIFSNAMNTVALAAERFASEMTRQADYEEARNHAMRAALIPITNSLFAVGIVSIPGMMTGQILSGVSPIIAARYQIMVMSMIYGSAGISVAFFLTLLKKRASEIQVKK